MDSTRWCRRLATCVAAMVIGLQAATAAADPCPPQPVPPSGADAQHARLNARDRGLLWRIERDGRSSWLYGTIHVGRHEWSVPGPAVRAALARSRRIAVELDLTDPATVQQVQQVLTGSLDLPEPLRRRLVRQAERACVDAEQLAGLHPVVQAITYGVLEARWEGLHSAWAQEFMLAGYARRTGKPVVSLETPQQQADALLPRSAEEALRAIEDQLEQLEQGQVRRITRRLADAWERGDLEDLAGYEQWCDCIRSEADRAALRRLQVDRNPGMAARIAALHDEGEVFAAVGALHMVGPQGLPALLAARGFRVERVHSGAPVAGPAR